jgi:hypothetical protein
MKSDKNHQQKNSFYLFSYFSQLNIHHLSKSSPPMFARRLLNPAKRAVQHRSKSSATDVPGVLYNNVWLKSTPLYVGYVFAGAVIVEFFYGIATTAVFETINRGVSCNS